jgi:divalent metal cation (Fe/Co/Zn/Cd) transporter
MSTKLKDDSVDDIQKLLNKQYNQRALFITSLGAVVNASLAGSKGFLGYSIGSTALIADCFNSLGDLFSDAVVYYTVTEARKRATPEKPWGSGKIEPLGFML